MSDEAEYPERIDFGDTDPEDAWDDEDSLEIKLAILERVVTTLRALSEVPRARRDDAIRLVLKLDHTRSEVAGRIDAIRAALEAL